MFCGSKLFALSHQQSSKFEANSTKTISVIQYKGSTILQEQLVILDIHNSSLSIMHSNAPFLNEYSDWLTSWDWQYIHMIYNIHPYTCTLK